MRCWPAWVCLAASQLACSPVGDTSPDRVLVPGAGSSVSSRSLCGYESEACCGAPLRECVFGSLCSATSGRCEAATEARGLVRLCRDGNECLAAETCCPSGLLATCIALGASAECPRPDLTANFDVGSLPGIFTDRIRADACEADCVSPGQHRLLSLPSLSVVNLGATPMLVGGPGTPGVRPTAGPVCGGEQPYAENLLRYEVLGTDGIQYTEGNPKFAPGCLARGGQPPFDCGFMGLARGRPSYDTLCNSVVLDGVPPGDYVLRVRVDPDDRVVESDETNNQIDFPFSLNGLDTLSECPPFVVSASEAERECGWTPSATANCVPGQELVLGCPGCQGDPMLRVCPGSEVCVSRESIAFNDDAEQGQSCPEVRFVCPAQGSYAAFVSSFVSQSPIQCAVTDVSADTQTPP
jgi:hypothetical protein